MSIVVLQGQGSANLEQSEPTDFRHNPDPYCSILALSEEKYVSSRYTPGQVAKQGRKTSSEALMKETPTQSSAALGRPLHAAARSSYHGSDQGTRSGSAIDVRYGASDH